MGEADQYAVFQNFDFWGNDAYSMLCDGSSSINDGVQTFTCQSNTAADDCARACSKASNDGSVYQGKQDWCVGWAVNAPGYQPPRCYIKYAVPGHGYNSSCGDYNTMVTCGIFDSYRGLYCGD